MIRHSKKIKKRIDKVESIVRLAHLSANLNFNDIAVRVVGAMFPEEMIKHEDAEDAE